MSNLFPPDPFGIFRIADKLAMIPGEGLLAIVIRDTAHKDTGAAINLCLECYRDNKRMAIDTLGFCLLNEILSYCKERYEEPIPTLERYLNNPNDDIPQGLYCSPVFGNYLAD